MPYATRTVVTDALETETGESTSRGYYSPDPSKEYVVTEPETHYYRVETTDVGRTETAGYEYSVEIDVDESSLSDTDRVHRFSDLPAHDRESLRSAVEDPRLLHAPHYTFSVTFAYEIDERRHRSPFVSNTDVHYLEWDGILLRLVFEQQRTVEITSTTVTAALVAESREEFFDYLCRERGVVLDSLTSQQREIVERAIEGTYTECQPHSEAFVDLRERLSTPGDGHVMLAQYDGDWYFVHFSR